MAQLLKKEVVIKKKLFYFLPPFSLTSFQNFKKVLAKKVSQTKGPILVLPATANEVVKAFFSRELRKKLFLFDFIVPDGMPLVWLGKIFFPSTERIYGPDLMKSFFTWHTQKKQTHFLYGGTPKSLQKLTQKLSQNHGNFKIVGSISPPFRDLSSGERKKIIQKINVLKPDFLWVGLGGEKQINWALSVKEELQVKCIIPVGAAFDFLSGEKPQAPQKMQKMGLEWLFRLVTEPKRLWKRYILQIPIFLVLFTLEAIKLIFSRYLFFFLGKKEAGINSQKNS